MVWNGFCVGKNILDFFEKFLSTSASLQHDITGVLQSQFCTYNDCKNCLENFNNYKNCLSQRPVPSLPPLMPPSAQEPGRRPALGCRTSTAAYRSRGWRRGQSGAGHSPAEGPACGRRAGGWQDAIFVVDIL